MRLGVSCSEKKKEKTMQEPKVFLPKKGNYQDLASYKKATVIYDLTFYFAKRFLDKGDRTIDQMVQAARSGKQNIAEGCAAAATSAETELKLVNVARASMKELLVDYEDYLRVRRLTKWAFDDERIQKTREFCKTHESSDDFMRGIDKRSDEAIANITITLLHQFDNIIGAYIAHLEKTFVEQGGIRERMTAARLGYRNDQKTCIAELETENSRLKARIAELEEKLKGLSPMSLTGLISLIGHIGLIGLMILGLTSCSGSGDDDLQESQPETNSDMVAITFNGSGGAETAVTRADGMPLSEKATTFTVWGYKNMSYSAGIYGETQCVFPSYVVNWTSNSAGTTTSNSNGWEYVAPAYNQTIKFWDWSANAYRFFAVTGWSGDDAPASVGGYDAQKAYRAGENAVSMLANAVPLLDGGRIDLAATKARMALAPYFSRLWFSTGDPVAYPDKQFGKPVVLEFLQPYTRVRFIFKYVFPREGIKLEDIQFKPSAVDSKILRKGTVTVSYPIQGTATSETFTTTPSDAAEQLDYFREDYDPEDDTKVYTETDKGWYVVLPNNAQGSYTMSVTVNKGVEPKTAVVPANYMQWLPGYSYTYIFKITDEGGVEIGWVETAVTPWTEMIADRTVYNW